MCFDPSYFCVFSTVDPQLSNLVYLSISIIRAPKVTVLLSLRVYRQKCVIIVNDCSVRVFVQSPAYKSMDSSYPNSLYVNILLNSIATKVLDKDLLYNEEYSCQNCTSYNVVVRKYWSH